MKLILRKYIQSLVTKGTLFDEDKKALQMNQCKIVLITTVIFCLAFTIINVLAIIANDTIHIVTT